jgi:hypothetical protein
MVDQNSSLVNFGNLAEPAKILIEKVSDAVGGVYKPRQIKRVAKAEAAAALIKATAQIEISELQQRALHRFLAEEAANQKNIESITDKAIPQLEEDANLEELKKTGWWIFLINHELFLMRICKIYGLQYWPEKQINLVHFRNAQYILWLR